MERFKKLVDVKLQPDKQATISPAEVMVFVEKNRKNLLASHSFLEAAKIIHPKGTKEELERIADILQYGARE